MPKRSLLGLISSLESTVRKLSWRPPATAWSCYYLETNYSAAGMDHKAGLVSAFLDKLSPSTVWDLGANTGEFSRIAAARGCNTIAFDIDVVAVEKNYLQVKANRETTLLPLLLDLTNPSPAIGWANQERSSIVDRSPVDVVMALALVHHLAIANNVPLELVANLLASMSRALIIEFVPRSDSQVQRLLATREDIFTHYDRDGFEKAFQRQFVIDEAVPVRDSDRTLYRMSRRSS